MGVWGGAPSRGPGGRAPGGGQGAKHVQLTTETCLSSAKPPPPAADEVFRLDALLALSVIATATWLAGWLSHSGIVSKRLNLSENFFDHLKAPPF